MEKSINFIPVLFILLIFLGCKQPEIKGNEQQTNPLSTTNNLKTTLPQNVQNYLAENLSEWNIPDTADYAKTWWSFHDSNAIPYYVVTDLNDDEIADYSIMVHNDKKITIVFLLGGKDSFSHQFATDFLRPFVKHHLEYGLSIEPPGRIDIALPEIRSIILKSNAINLLELENRLGIYFFADNRLGVFTTK